MCMDGSVRDNAGILPFPRGETMSGAERDADPGTLHVVATPIGNLGDLSPRAQQVLRAVSAVCAEDTRRSGQLLSHFGIDTPLAALHEHTEDALSQRIVQRPLAGE